MAANLECPYEDDGSLAVGSQIVGQHLFLGASVASFNSTGGWGGSPSTLTVELVNDLTTCLPTELVPGSQFSTLQPIFNWRSDFGEFNHYYNCKGNACYIDEYGLIFDPNRSGNPSTEKNVPGKVVHSLYSEGLLSKYWLYSDPGFLGQLTRIRPDGTWNNLLNTNDFYRYDLIDVPVYFRFGYFTFGGFITNWESNNRTSNPSFTVTISSPESILKNCKVILSKYAGSIFTRLSNLGGPTNYAGWNANYTGTQKQGNLANVFNVYGFLESYGYGTSQSNDNGIPLSYILDSLSVLTSATSPGSNRYIGNLENMFPGISQSMAQNRLGSQYHAAFSPYGRIIGKPLVTDPINKTISPIAASFSLWENGLGFGVINPELDQYNVPRTQFLLDLSEIPRPPSDVRYNGSDGIANIIDIIDQACEVTGRDWYATLIRKNAQNFIKIKTVNRTIAVPTNTIETLVKNLESASPAIPVTASSFGKSKNESATPRVLYIGANQHRLYQTKSYLLGYSNTHLVYNPHLKKFVDYYRFCKTGTDSSVDYGSPGFRGFTLKDKKQDVKTISSGSRWVNSYKLPLSYSTRNPDLSNALNGPIITTLFSIEQNIANLENIGNYFTKVDSHFTDIPVGGSNPAFYGNYWQATTDSPFCGDGSEDPKGRDRKALEDCEAFDNVGTDSTPRYIPLSLTSICPFFGYASDQLVEPHENKGSNLYRFVRPVYLDTWAGTLVIGFRSNEGPMLSFGTLSAYYYGIMNHSPPIASAPPVPGAGVGSGGTPSTVDPDPKSPVLPSAPDGGPAVPTPTTGVFETRPYNNYNLNNIGFTVTETEIRAAEAGWEQYLAYCLLKMPYSKPDLFTMIVNAYAKNGKLFTNAAFDPSTLPPGGGIGSATSPSTVPAVSDVGHGPAINLAGTLVSTAQDALNLNFNWTLSSDFIKDWKRITEFVAAIGNKYYGKQYLVKIPEVLSYRDTQYADLQIPIAGLGIRGSTGFGDLPGVNFPSSVPTAEELTLNSISNPNSLPNVEVREPTDSEDTMFVFQGSAKIFFNYELTDSAWEEPGNSIDDSIIVGSPDYFKLCTEDGKIPPIVGYNANPVKDYVAQKWCEINIATKLQKWKESNIPEAKKYKELIEEGKIYEAKKLEASVVGRSIYNCSLSMAPSIDIGSTDNYVLTIGKDSGREDPFGNATIGTPVTLYNGDILVHPQTQETITTIELEDNPFTETRDESQGPLTFGKRIPIPTMKVYYPTTCNNEFVFLDPISLKDPRALIDAPGLNLYDASMSYTTDPTLTIIANAASEDYSILINMAERAVSENEQRSLLQYLDSITSDMKWMSGGKIVERPEDDDERRCQAFKMLQEILLGLISVLNNDSLIIRENHTTPQSTKHYTIAPRKANPFFAAVPLQDNVNCYGPWTNHTTIAIDPYDKFAVLRRYPNQSFQSVLSTSEIMINDTDVKKNDEWAPWNYGGMAFLDREIINQITAKTTYQLQLEDGQISTAGTPVFNLNGDIRIRTVDSDVYRQFRMMFMNYSYDIILPFDYERYLYGYAGLVISNIGVSVSDRNITTQYRFQTYNAKLGLYNKEISDRNKIPSKLRIAFASQIGKTTKQIQNKIINQISKIVKDKFQLTARERGGDYESKLFPTSAAQYLVGSASYTIPAMGLPYCGDPGLATDYKALSDSVTPNNLKAEGEYLHTIGRTKNWVGAFEPRESLSELQTQYASKALMSLDGIFSPVSFYPTYDLGTYPISSRFITSDLKSKNVTCPMCNDDGVISFFKGEPKVETIHPCPMCNKPILEVPSETLKDETDPADVNFKTLNPIVVPYGEFQNYNSQLKTNPYERSRHNISVIGRQETPIDGRTSLNLNDNLTLIVDKDNNMTNYDYAARDGSVPDGRRSSMHNPDFYEFDLDYTGSSEILLNQRFFAFRGPMMLHGWGYDTEGFPVPNEADEPKSFDSAGRPLRFVLTNSGTNDYSKEPKYLPSNGERLGDIFGKGYVKVSGKWIRQPVNKFHLNWAERSDLWPIGPVDLRWDRERKVWAGGGFVQGPGGGNIRIGRFMNQWPSLGNVKEPMNCVKDVHLYRPVTECPQEQTSQYNDNAFCGWILEPETVTDDSGNKKPNVVKVMNILANVAAAEYQAKWCMVTESNGYYYLLAAEC